MLIKSGSKDKTDKVLRSVKKWFTLTVTEEVSSIHLSILSSVLSLVLWHEITIAFAPLGNDTRDREADT